MKRIRVEDVYRVHGMASAVVPEGTGLEEVVTRFAQGPGVRAIFLIDSRQRFAALITDIDLLKWVQFRFFGGGRSRGIAVGDVLRVVFATKAKDLAQGDWRSLGIKPTDTLETALEEMIAHGEDTIPVLDDEGKILADLTLSEVLQLSGELDRQIRA